MPWGQDGTIARLCVRWGRDKGAPGEKNLTYPDQEQMPKPFCPSKTKRQFRKGCTSTVGKRGSLYGKDSPDAMVQLSALASSLLCCLPLAENLGGISPEFMSAPKK